MNTQSIAEPRTMTSDEFLATVDLAGIPEWQHKYVLADALYAWMREREEEEWLAQVADEIDTLPVEDAEYLPWLDEDSIFYVEEAEDYESWMEDVEWMRRGM